MKHKIKDWRRDQRKRKRLVVTSVLEWRKEKVKENKNQLLIRYQEIEVLDPIITGNEKEKSKEIIKLRDKLLVRENPRFSK